jgi:hypothetical protein
VLLFCKVLLGIINMQANKITRKRE